MHIFEFAGKERENWKLCAAAAADCVSKMESGRVEEEKEEREEGEEGAERSRKRREEDRRRRRRRNGERQSIVVLWEEEGEGWVGGVGRIGDGQREIGEYGDYEEMRNSSDWEKDGSQTESDNRTNWQEIR